MITIIISVKIKINLRTSTKKRYYSTEGRKMND